MNPNWLWAGWAVISFGGFAVLETIALWKEGGLEPLTFWVRAGIAASPALIGAGLFMGFAWLIFHFFLENSVRGWKRGKQAGHQLAMRVKAKRRGRGGD